MENQTKVFELSDLNSICDKTIVLEREIETKRSRREGESQADYKLVKPLKQTLRVEFNGVHVREIFEKALGTIGVSYQNGTSRTACDKLDADAQHQGDGWKAWILANPVYVLKLNEKRSGTKAEIPIEQRIAAMSSEQLASSMSEEQLLAALEAAKAKREKATGTSL